MKLNIEYYFRYSHEGPINWANTESEIPEGVEACPGEENEEDLWENKHDDNPNSLPRELDFIASSDTQEETLKEVTKSAHTISSGDISRSSVSSEQVEARGRSTLSSEIINLNSPSELSDMSSVSVLPEDDNENSIRNIPEERDSCDEQESRNIPEEKDSFDEQGSSLSCDINDSVEFNTKQISEGFILSGDVNNFVVNNDILISKDSHECDNEGSSPVEHLNITGTPNTYERTDSDLFFDT